ncbi:SPASM domain-containing protein [Candidatus Woesearchaeota archaeon]|nr:SPASM domain-containing protein [Candidatus Woesearchaeota archaeon]
MANLAETPKRIVGNRTDATESILAGELGSRYIEYRKTWVSASKREIVTPFPLYIQIEHSGKCNLRCVHCIHGQENLKNEYSRGVLSMELYEKILSEASKYNCPSISFHNNDEPLLLPDLELRIAMAKKYGFIDIILVTNGTLLTKERADSLLKSGLTKINFSVDCADAETYKKVRGGDFNRVVENIDYFLSQKKKLGLKLPITRATCVLSKHTSKNMDRFQDFWGKRVDIVEFQNFQVLRGFTEHLSPENSGRDESFACNSPWQQVVIRANGDVLPCCSFYSKELVVGNVNRDTIHDIWNGEAMKRMRRELKSNNFEFNPFCKSCSETFFSVK